MIFNTPEEALVDAALTRDFLTGLLNHIKECQDAAEHAIEHFGKDSRNVMIGRVSVLVDIRHKIEKELENLKKKGGY